MNAYEQGFNEKCAEYNINPHELIKSAISLMQISKAINRWALGLNDVKGFGKTMSGKPEMPKYHVEEPIMSPRPRIGVSK